MELTRAHLALIAAALTILAISFPIDAQANQNARVLAKLESDIEAGKLAQSEIPVSDYAFAHPTDAKAVELLARLRLKQERLDEAVALYKKVLVLDPQFTTAKVNYATALILAGRSDSAVEILNGIDPSHIDDQATLLDLAQAQVLVGNCDRALAVAATLPVKVLNSDALAIRATCYARLGRTSDVDALVPVAKQAATLTPDAVMKFAAVMVDAGRPEITIDVLQPVLRAMPNSAKPLTMLSKAELMQKDLASARRHLASAASLDPLSPEVAYLQAELEVAQGNAAAAIPLLKKALQLAPNSADILAKLALTAIKADQPRDAVEAAEKLLALKPDDPEGLYLLGAAALQGGDIEKARSNLERYAILRPKDVRGCIALGLSISALKDQVEPARQQLFHCIEIDPANIEAKYQIGLSYKAQGDTAKAIQYLEETVIAAPRYALALRDLGTVYLQAGNETKAREMLERAVAIAPDDPDTHFQLSRLYNLMGDTALAKQHLDTFQKIKNKKGQ